MRGVGAVALMLCGLAGFAASGLALSTPVLVSKASGNAGSAGSDGDGDHMAPGEVENTDPVTDGGPDFASEAREDAEHAADGAN